VKDHRQPRHANLLLLDLKHLRISDLDLSQ